MILELKMDFLRSIQIPSEPYSDSRICKNLQKSSISGGFTSNTPPSKTDFSFLEGGYSKIFDWVVFEGGGILRKILRKNPKCGGACGGLLNMFIEVSIMLSDYYLMHTYTQSINKLSTNYLIFSLGNPSLYSRNTFLPYVVQS